MLEIFPRDRENERIPNQAAIGAPGRYVRILRGVVVPILIFVALTIWLTYPLSFHLTDRLRDDGDSFEYAWVIGFGAYQLLHHPLHLFDGNIFYPFPLSLAYSDSSVPDIVLATPLVALTGNPILGLNVQLLLTFILGGLGVYLFARQRTHSWWAGLVAGILYAFTPYRYDHVAQLPNVSMEWAPFALWAFDRYLATERKRWAAAAAAFTFLQVLVSFYYAFILGFGIAIYVAARLVERRTFLRPTVLAPLVVSGAVAAIALIPFVAPYFQLNARFGLHRRVEEAEYFSAWPANYLAATTTMRVVLIDPLLRVTYHLPWSIAPVAASERHLYPGLLVVVLAVVGLAWRPGWRVVAPVTMIVTGVLLSFGPFLHLNPGVVEPLPIDLPYVFLFQHLPGFEALRVPSRFAALVILGLTILAGDGLASLQCRLDRGLVQSTYDPVLTREGAANPPPSRVVPLASRISTFFCSGDVTKPGAALIRPSLALALLCGAVGVVEGLNWFPTNPVNVGSAVPAVYRWLAANPTPGPIVELPIDDNAYRESPRSYYSTYHHRPTVDGFRSFLPPAYHELASVISAFPSPESVNVLRQLGVRYVVVHQAELSPVDRGLLPRVIQAAKIEPAAHFGSDVVYPIVGAPAPEHISVDLTPPSCALQRNQSGGLPITLTSTDGNPVLLLTPGARALDLNVTWKRQDGATYTQRSRVDVPAWVLTSPARFTVPFTAPPEGGVYELHLAIDGQPGLALEPSPASGAVALVAPPATTTPHLFQAILVSREATPAAGPQYELVWQVPDRLAHPLVAFVNAYDDRFRYWSFPSGQEPRFPAPVSADPALSTPGATSGGCSGGLTVVTTRLLLQPTTPPGSYHVEAGLLDPVTKQRVPFIAPNGAEETRVVLGSFWITPPNVIAPSTVPASAVQSENFGNTIALQNLELRGQPVPSGTIDVSLLWRSLKRTPTNYTVFVHLVDGAGTLVAQHDAQPTNGIYPTSAWEPGEAIVDLIPITLPPNLPPGPYNVEVGLYDVTSGQRLPLLDESGKTVGDLIRAPVQPDGNGTASDSGSPKPPMLP